MQMVGSSPKKILRVTRQLQTSASFSQNLISAAMIEERILTARRKLREALITLGVEIPPELEDRFALVWYSYVTGDAELSDLRAAFGELRDELHKRARAEWAAELQQVEAA
jgi:hypothetical protein